MEFCSAVCRDYWKDGQAQAERIFQPKQPTQHDPVNHPAHYTSHPSGVECIQVTEHYNFCVGNAIKYLWRAGLKTDNPIEDIKKAAWYVKREIDRLEKANKE